MSNDVTIRFGRSALAEAGDQLLNLARPKLVRSMREFAEAEVILPPTGPRKNEPYRCANQPFTGVLLDELHFGNWRTTYVTGPSQSSKTLTAFVIPTLFQVSEIRENTILSFPEADMADDKWRADMVPVMEASPSLKWLLPTKGPGSKGGKVKDTIELSNGVLIKIMTLGGRYTNKAGFTSRFVRITEASGYSGSLESSPEADPFRQLRARMRGYPKAQQRMTVEGTVTLPEDLPWRARGTEPENSDEPIISTMSKLVTPCPHCGVFISLEREHFLGWKGADSEQQAADEARFFCSACGEALDDDDRAEANRDIKLLHYGQTIDKRGRMNGDPPPTSNLWFRWSQWHNLLVPMGDVAIDEWMAAQCEEDSGDANDAERELCQFVWSIPYVPDDMQERRLDSKTVRKRRTNTPQNVLPESTEFFTFGIDPGKWTMWYVAKSFLSDRSIVIPAYGGVTVLADKDDATDEEALELALFAALCSFRDEVIEPGFPVMGSAVTKGADKVWIDRNWMTETVCAFCRESNQAAGVVRYVPVRGQGITKNQYGHARGQYRHPKKKNRTIRTIGDQFYLERNHERRVVEGTFNADFYKLQT